MLVNRRAIHFVGIGNINEARRQAGWWNMRGSQRSLPGPPIKIENPKRRKGIDACSPTLTQKTGHG